MKRGHAVEREAFDEDSGRWVSSAACPISGWTPDGKGVFFHMVAQGGDAVRVQYKTRLRDASLEVEEYER